jgi:hypothetical protein
LPISASISSLGMTPASDSSLALTRTMNRMLTPRGRVLLPRRRTSRREIDVSSP